MVEFAEHTLNNGLRILVNQDTESELIAVNLIYKVGAKDENPNRTGFAHLFEHLMFGGSINIPDYDTPLQRAGGENNAFTNNDYTNYYITLPHQNLETAFWLESDRMLQLDFSQKSLEVQKKVVIEEFNQRYYNQPYGDIWLLLRPLAYSVHPYSWAAIGKDISHIENASLADVKGFFNNFYLPNNSILSLSGNVEPDIAFKLAEKWFGDIKSGEVKRPNYSIEPVQTSARRLEVEREVPADTIYIAFHMGGRTHREYYLGDVLSDLLSNGSSSRLTRRFIKEEQLFTEVNAFITGDLDPSLFILTAKPVPGVSLERAEKSLLDEVAKLTMVPIGDAELEKVRNKIEANYTYSQTSILNKAMTIGFFDMIDKLDNINTEMEIYHSIKQTELQEFAEKLFQPANSSTLYYRAKQ